MVDKKEELRERKRETGGKVPSSLFLDFLETTKYELMYHTCISTVLYCVIYVHAYILYIYFYLTREV